jgi:hypothetical protein
MNILKISNYSKLLVQSIFFFTINKATLILKEEKYLYFHKILYFFFFSKNV